MTDLAIQFAATVTLFYAMWCIGHHQVRGPIVSAASEALWFKIGITHNLPFLSFLSVVLVVIHVRNAWRWWGAGCKF